MKTRMLLITLAMVISGFFAIKAQDLTGYTLHESNQGVYLYYKVTEYGILFRVKNTREKTVHVIINNVTGEWSDGRKRTKNVKVTYVPAGSIRTAVYDHSDNYSKLTGTWSFNQWRWTENSNEIE